MAILQRNKEKESHHSHQLLLKQGRVNAIRHCTGVVQRRAVKAKIVLVALGEELQQFANRVGKRGLQKFDSSNYILSDQCSVRNLQ